MKLSNLPASPASAQRLLGSVLRCGSVSGRIVETEFYDQTDPASHTFGGRTDRNWPMFEEAGHLYVYRSYGIHWCANVVVGSAGWGSAVLIRALSPSSGIELMRDRRPKARTDLDLCSGPGKLTAALEIVGEDSGLNLMESDRIRLTFGPEPKPEEVRTGPRVGISKAVDTPWRFALDDPNVSRPRL